MPDPYDPNQAVREKTAMDVLSEHGLGWLDDDRPCDDRHVHGVVAEAAVEIGDLVLGRDARGGVDTLPPKDDGKIHTIADIEEVLDNWQHRSDMMKCRTCMWYVPKRSGAKREIGRCRHSSPTIKGWPAIYPDDWCGAHKLDEEKV